MLEPNFQLGISNDILVLHSQQQLTKSLADMISQSRSTIRIFSNNLEPSIYNKEAIYQPLATMIRRNQRAAVQILIQDIDPAIKADHALVRLMNHLSSFVEIRMTTQEHKTYNHAFALIDDCGYYHRQPQDSRQYKLCYNNRLKVRNMTHQFTIMWNSSLRASSLMRLHI